MIRVPRRLLDPEIASLYCQGESASSRATVTHVILEFVSDDEEGGRWVEDSEGSEWLSSLVPLHSDLANGDLRLPYLGWLLCAQNWELDGDDAEPQVPPGLGKLSAALDAFADFVRIGKDLIAVAAERSLDRAEVEPSAEEFRQWVHSLAETDKDVLLLRLIEGKDVHLRSEFLRRFREERATAEPAPNSDRKNRRRVAELLAAAEKHAEVRRREEVEREARERARRQREEEAAARAKHLDSLKGREEEIWLRVESLIEARQAREYDQALQHLHDLRDLGKRSGGIDQFGERVAKLRAQNPGKQGLLRRLDQAAI